MKGRMACEACRGRRPGRVAPKRSAPRLPHDRRAFSLLELLVVIAIIGILAAISFPAMKNIGKTNEMQSGVQQVLDDLTLARQKAINQQTIVSLVFVPADMRAIAYNPSVTVNAAMVTNLLDAPFRGYALFAKRSVGDQPGRPTESYDTEWKRLADGVVFQQDQYDSVEPTVRENINIWADRPFRTNTYIFPTVYGSENILPFVAFDGQGSLVDRFGEKTYEDEYVDLARGSILATRNDQGELIDFDVREVKEGPREERFARIQIDAFSGRARVIPDKDL